MENKQETQNTINENTDELPKADHLSYSDEEEIIFGLANRQLDILKQTLNACVIAEKECYKIFIKNNPNESRDNALWRIQSALEPIHEEIKRCETIDAAKAEKTPKRKPKVSPIEPLKQVAEFK